MFFLQLSSVHGNIILPVVYQKTWNSPWLLEFSSFPHIQQKAISPFFSPQYIHDLVLLITLIYTTLVNSSIISPLNCHSILVKCHHSVQNSLDGSFGQKKLKGFQYLPRPYVTTLYLEYNLPEAFLHTASSAWNALPSWPKPSIRKLNREDFPSHLQNINYHFSPFFFSSTKVNTFQVIISN